MATTVDIIADATTNKVLVETQLKRFIDAGAKQRRPKKVKTATTSVDENIVDLVSTPPLPSPTQITQEDIPQSLTSSPVDICKNAMLETLKERLNHDGDFQAYIEKLPKLFTSAQKITTKCPLIESSSARQTLS